MGSVEEPRYVLQERVSGLYFANDTNGVGPAVPLIVFSSLFACDGEWLAREAPRHHVYLVLPDGPVERTHITEDGGVVNGSVLDARSEHFLTVLVPLNVGEGLPPEETRGKHASPCPGE